MGIVSRKARFSAHREQRHQHSQLTPRSGEDSTNGLQPRFVTGKTYYVEGGRKKKRKLKARQSNDKVGSEMQFQSLGQIIVDVIDARTQLRKIGISTTGTRLEKIQDYLDELLNPTTPGVNPLAVNANEEDTYYALSDGASFGRIAAELTNLPSHLLPRRTLRDILKGPLVPSQEKSGPTATPRNKFVELELAAHCSSAGCKLLGFDDLTFEFEGCRYAIECKRPAVA